MAWFYTVLLAGCSAGIVAFGAVITLRIFRDEALAAEPTGDADVAGGHR